MNKDRKTVEYRLVELGYFKYADSDEVIQETFKDYKNDGRIKFPFKGLNRTFGIDAEFIYEAGGLEDHVKHLAKVFDKIGIHLEIGNCVEECDYSTSTYSRREIEINNKIYETPNVRDWGTAFNSGFKLANQLLEEYNFDGKVFGLYMDEGSWLIILNEDRFDYLTELMPEDCEFRPIDIEKMLNDNYGE